MSRWTNKNPRKKTKIHTICFEASRKMGIGWKGNVVGKVFPGSQADELGVRVGFTAVMLNAKKIPSSKGMCGEKMRNAVSKGKNFSVMFREILVLDENEEQDAKSASPRSTTTTTKKKTSVKEEISQMLLDMDTSSSIEVQTQFLRRRFQRDVNCVTDPVAAKRRNALNKLRETCQILVEKSPDLMSSLFQSEFRVVLLRAASKDPSETCREIALSTLLCVSTIETSNDEVFLKETTQMLTQRIGKKPFLENSEELRLLLLKLLNALLSSKSTHGVASQLLDDLRNVLSVAVLDTFPEVKSEALQAMILISRAIPGEVHMHIKSLVESALSAIRHQHSRIRQKAISTAGELLLYCSEGLNSVMEKIVLPAFERLPFDASSSVRQTAVDVLAQCLARLESRHEYSANLFQILLSLLGDATESIAQRSLQRLEWIARYLQDQKMQIDDEEEEMSTDLRIAAEAASLTPLQERQKHQQQQQQQDVQWQDMSLSEDMFPKPFQTRPSENLREYARRMWSKTLRLTLRDLGDWTTGKRSFAALQLRSMLVLCESYCTVSLTHMLTSMRLAFHNIFDGLDRDNSDICVYDCARLIGCFCDSQSIFDIVLPWARGDKGLSSSMQRCSSLALLSSCIEGLHLRSSLLKNNPLNLTQLGHVARLVSDTSLCGTDEAPLKKQVIRLVYAVVDSSSTRDVVRTALERRDTHSSPVTVAALEMQLNLMRTILQLKAREDDRPTNSLLETALSKAHGMNLEQIHITHARALLDMATRDLNVWSIDGPNAHGRRLFEQILRLSSYSSLAPLTNEIVNVFTSVLPHVDRDPKLRLALLASLEEFLNRCIDSNNILTCSLRNCSEILLERVLFPCCVWRVGMVESTLRKLAMAAALALVSRIGFKSFDIVTKQFRTSQGTLMSCLEDDDITTRRISCRVLTKIFDFVSQATSQRLSYEQINDLYPKLLKRLDDSDDEIRKESCFMLIKFWSAAEKTSFFHETCMVYTFDVLLLHLDDPSIEIQRAVFEALRSSCKLHPKLLTQKAAESRGKHRSPEFCDELVRLSSSMIVVEKKKSKKSRVMSKMDIDDDVGIDTADLDDIDE